MQSAVNISEADIVEAKRLKAIRMLCENDLVFFAAYFFKEMRGDRFIENHHHYKIAKALLDIEQGGNLLINLPPRYGKTELGVISWMAQSLARNPKARFIHLSFSSELALENSARCRELIKSPAFQQLWPLKIKPDADSKAKWYTEEGGGVYATQAGGAVTGFGAGVTEDNDDGLFGGAIIIDDPLKPDDARSELERNKVNERLNNTIKSRRNNKKTPLVIIMQRLHEDDMSGFVLRNGMGEPFKHVKLPALQDDGTALWPMKHTVEMLHKMRDAPEDRGNFWSQYQQEPAPADGEVFKRDWFLYEPLPPKAECQIVHSWDTAFKAKEHNDPSALTVWWIHPVRGVFLAEVVNKKMEYPDLKRAVVEYMQRDTPVATIIEDKASGQSLIQELRISQPLPIIAIKPENDKETRARTCAAFFEGKKVTFHEDATWLQQYENQLLLFPNSLNDDMVDSTSQFINWWRTQSYGLWNEQIKRVFDL